VFLFRGLAGNFYNCGKGFLSLDPISLTVTALSVTCKFQVNFFLLTDEMYSLVKSRTE